MNVFSKMKLGPKLIIFFLLVGIIPLITMGILSYNQAHAALEAETENNI